MRTKGKFCESSFRRKAYTEASTDGTMMMPSVLWESTSARIFSSLAGFHSVSSMSRSLPACSNALWMYRASRAKRGLVRSGTTRVAA